MPAVNRSNMATLNLKEYRVTTKAISDPSNKIKNTAGRVIKTVLVK